MLNTANDANPIEKTPYSNASDQKKRTYQHFIMPQQIPQGFLPSFRFTLLQESQASLIFSMKTVEKHD